MPKTKSKTAFASRSKIKFDKTLVMVITAVVVATGGYLYYQASHAASTPWRDKAAQYGCGPLNADGIPPTISQGSTGNCVRLLQMVIRNYNAQTITVDGSFGAGTKSAVVSFQSYYHLATDGIVGPGTWSSVRLAFNYAPSFLHVASQSRTQIQIAWNRPTVDGDITGYYVYRNGRLIKTLSTAVSTFVDSGLTSGTPYAYSVSSLKGGTTSIGSGTIPASTLR